MIKITNGDRAAAIKMLEDPDELDKYPEIQAIILASDGAGGDEDEEPSKEDWEQTEDTVEKERIIIYESLKGLIHKKEMLSDDQKMQIKSLL